MDKFSIEIPNTKAASYKVVTVIILLMNVLIFGYLAFTGSDGGYGLLCMLGLGINVIAALAVFFTKYFKGLKAVKPEIIFIISAVIWIIVGKWLIALLMFLFAFTGIFTNRKLIIVFSEEGILYPSFPAKQFVWADVSQVLMKDDILTIDLHNNQLLQFNIDPATAAGIDTIAFNTYCRSRLNSTNL